MTNSAKFCPITIINIKIIFPKSRTIYLLITILLDLYVTVSNYYDLNCFMFVIFGLFQTFFVYSAKYVSRYKNKIKYFFMSTIILVCIFSF